MHFAVVFFPSDNVLQVFNTKELGLSSKETKIPVIGSKIKKDFKVADIDKDGNDITITTPFDGYIVFEDQCKYNTACQM